MSAGPQACLDIRQDGPVPTTRTSEPVGAVRRAIRDGAVEPLRAIDPDAITARLGGGPVKEIDLVIRTSGERQLSGFRPWQVAHAEVHVSSTLWPDFVEADFDVALGHFRAASARAGGTT